MPGMFELKTSAAGQVSFVLKADNGEVILRSETYDTVAAAEKGIASVRANCGRADHFAKHVAKDGSFYFNLMAANGLVIGTSETYTTEAAREKGIDSVRTNGTTEVVVHID